MSAASGETSAASPPPMRAAHGETPGSLLHLWALSALAIAQPLLDLLGRQPEFFAIRRFAPWQIVAFAAALVVVAPAPLGILAAVAKIRPRLGRVVHLILLGGLLALLALLALRRTQLGGWAWLAAGLVCGAAAAAAYSRYAWVRQLVGVCALGLVLFPAAFLLAPGVRRQLTSGEGGERAPSSGARTPIVIVVTDELTTTDLLDEQGRIDALAFPNLAALAAGATWFRNALTVSDVTELAIPAMLTGRLPSVDLLPTARDHPHNLFAALPEYRIVASEPITRLANRSAPDRLLPSDLRPLLADLSVVYGHLLLPESWRARLPGLEGRWSGFSDGGEGSDGELPVEAVEALRSDREAQFDRFLEEIDPAEDRVVHFLHVLLPHTPWEFLPSGRRYLTLRNRVPGLLPNEFWSERESFAREAYQRYLLQVQYLDRRIGDLLRRLRATGRYERSLIVFVADHGTSFRPGGSRRAYTPANEPDILPVPLIIKRPGQDVGEVVSRRVSTLDLYATVLDAIGARPPWPLERGSLFAPRTEPAPDRFLAKHRGLVPIAADLDHRILERLRWKRSVIEVEGEAPARLVLRRSPGSPVGRPLAELEIAPTTAGDVQLDSHSMPEQGDARGAFARAWISGTIRPTSPDAGCCELAVALDGRVVATTAVDAERGERRFGVLVPEWDLPARAERVEILRVSAGSPPRLSRFRFERGESARVGLRADGEGRPVALQRGAAEIPLRPGSMGGFFELRHEGAVALVSGWAFDLERRAAAHEILVFHGGRLVASGTPEGVRPDVDAALGIEVPGTRTAFEFPVEAALLPDLERAGVTVVATGDERAAAELGVFRYLRSGPDGRPTLVEFSDGRRFSIQPDALAGGLLEWTETEHGTEITGWAWDTRRALPAERVIAFRDGRAVREVQTFEKRPESAAAAGAPKGARLAFRLTLPAPEPGAAAAPLTLVAIGRHGNARVLER